jgi:hypothetical protein
MSLVNESSLNTKSIASGQATLLTEIGVYLESGFNKADVKRRSHLQRKTEELKGRSGHKKKEF